MTVNQFIEWINEHREQLTGDETIAVGALGGIGGHGHVIEKVCLGFDWDKGKLMMQTKTPLMVRPAKAPRQS
jgi:hypothetical protein